MTFLSGPLTQSDATYEEEVGTGRKTFTFKDVSSNFLSQSSSSRTAMTCTSVGDPIEYEKFGNESVPALLKGSGGLAGLYAVKQKANAEESKKYEIYVFHADGRVFTGEPDGAVKDITCLATFPSGKPRCNTYRVEGEKIVLNNGYRDYKFLQRDSLIQVPTDVTRIDGTFTAAIGGTSGLCVPFSSCSSWYEKQVRQFTPDGRFSTDSSSLSTISSSVGVGSAHGRSNSKASDSGQYQIEGNVLTLEYGDGVVEKKFIAVLNSKVIQTGNWTYFLDNE